jgi:hypothetical protein
VLTLAAFLSGCSSYRHASLPGVVPEEVESNSETKIWIGQNARITLNSGKVVAGTVEAVTADSISVGRIGNYGLEVTSAKADEIALVEVEYSSRTENIIVISVVAGAIVGGILAVALNGIPIPAGY